MIREELFKLMEGLTPDEHEDLDVEILEQVFQEPHGLVVAVVRVGEGPEDVLD